MATLAGLGRDIPRGLPPVYLEPTRSPAGQIDIGTCVRVSLSGDRSRLKMTEEGIVIEVVAPDTEVQSTRVVGLRVPIAEEPRYVVQCWSRRVLRYASGLVVVSL